MLEIQLLKGPLNKRQLQYIVELYGVVDKKYASPEYCDYLFNNNTSGFSFHAFAVIRKHHVGHISLIPMQIDTPDGIRISLKAEAFYLKPEYRDEWVTYQEEELPIGLAMPKVIYDFALNEDYKVIHLLADDEIGKIHTFAGCLEFPLTVRESFLILLKTEYTSREIKVKRKLMISFVAMCQRTINTLFKGIFFTFHKNDCIIKTICDTDKTIPSYIIKNPWQWSIALTQEYQAWLAKSPYIRVCFYDGTSNDYVVFKESEYPNRITEIIGCYSKKNNWYRLTKILQCIIHYAKSKQASSVNIKHFPNLVYPKSLLLALAISGFLNKNTKLSCFIKSNESDYYKKENLAYTPFFYIQF